MRPHKHIYRALLIYLLPGLHDSSKYQITASYLNHPQTTSINIFSYRSKIQVTVLVYHGLPLFHPTISHPCAFIISHPIIVPLSKHSMKTDENGHFKSIFGQNNFLDKVNHHRRKFGSETSDNMDT